MTEHALTPKAYWDRYYETYCLNYDPSTVLFKDILARHVVPGSSCFEVGCYPGSYLVYLNKTYGCPVGGIDFTNNIPHMLGYMKMLAVDVTRIYNADFREVHIPEQFDFVYSLGFLEHFRDFDNIINKHVDLLRTGGTMFLACPNFRRLQYLLHRVFDRQNLERHVLPAMELARWRAVLEARGLRVVEEGYYGTTGFWVEPQPRRPVETRFIQLLSLLTATINARVSCPNQWTSPYLYCVAEKRG